MPVLLTEFLMQPDPTTGTAQTGAARGGGTPAPTTGSQLQMFLPLALMFVVFYFLLLRPQQKRQKETEALVKALKRGDLVRTSGGIRGEITDLTDTDVTLMIADKVKINVLRSHITGKAEVATSKEKA